VAFDDPRGLVATALAPLKDTKGKVFMSRESLSDRLVDIAQIGGIKLALALTPNGMLGLLNAKEKSWQSNQSVQF
jgi:hypothetical protein